MNKLFGLGYSRLANDQVAYFGRAAAGQREGLQFIVLAESDSQLQALWSQLNPSVPLDPKAVHNCGLTHAGTLRRFFRSAEVDDLASAEGESADQAQESARRQQLRRLEKLLLETVQAGSGAAPQELKDALSWVVQELNRAAVGSNIRAIKARAVETAESTA